MVEEMTRQRIEPGSKDKALEGLLKRLQGLEIPADAICWRRFFGSMILVLLTLLFLSGVLMAFFYSPVPGTAYDSVDHLQFNLPMGNLLRGVHHYAWNLL